LKLENGVIETVGLPYDELKTVMEIMDQAEKADNLEALKWSARKIAWLYKISELDGLIGAEFSNLTVNLFNDAWQGHLKTDPPPCF
jgi:hypothetical protein